ncbi:hypothetical protein [Niveispirillum sp.]|uniref:hypothetical protein n=1 Tax=Niveispirillum sp. TaxID=1917217 RepID=UPI001B50141C|nr:hypothetical protein [Niveispirillum sp.]MBP7337496.1 hypothetical protein [Niveispirillum sp.]
MLPLRYNVRANAVLAAAFTLSVATSDSQAEERGSGFLAFQRWLHAADVAANDAVTYEICGWGMIDLRTPFLAAAIKQGVDVTAWDDLAERYDDAARERRQTEAVLTARGANAPMQRTSGLYATGGCTEALRKRIWEQSEADQTMRALPATP